MLLKLMRQYLRPYWHSVLLIVVLQLAQAIASLALPSLNAKIIDHGVVTGNLPYIWHTGLLMMAITGIQLLGAAGATYLSARTAMAVGRDLRRDIFTKVQSFSSFEVKTFGAPSLITRSTNDVQQVQMFVMMACAILLIAPVMATGGIIMAINEDLGLSSLLLVAIPALAAVLGIMTALMVPQFKRLQSQIDTLNKILREQLTGVRVIRAYGRQDTEADRYDLANTELRQVGLRIFRLFALMLPAVMIVMNGSSVAVIYFGAWRIDSGAMQVGSLIAFLSYLIQILLAIMISTMVIMMAPRASVCADRIGAVMNTTATIPPPSAPDTVTTKNATFALHNVSFAFPGAEANVLTGLDLALLPGKTTAVIGPTGSGKSTLAALLPRLIDPTSGSVTMNGTDLRELDPATVRAQIAYVPQTAYLFAGTISSNLQAPNPAAAQRALEFAQASDFVAELADGLEANVEQGGRNFSGGQRQRLAMARAFARPASLYVFDDSFSALDYGTDARIRARLPEATRAAAVLIVAQRVATIRGADEILVLENGQIVGRGTHTELMENCDTYREIVLSQLSAQEAQ